MRNLSVPVIGLVVLIFGLIELKRRNALMKSGKVSEGVIFDLVNGSDSNIYPVVRFLNTKKEWITERSHVGSRRAAFKKGEKVTIFYNEANPKEFIIRSWSENLLPYVFIIAGCVTIIAGSYLFLKES